MAYIYVINSKGEREPFSYQKVRKSAERAGAGPLLAKEIADIIEKEVYPGIKTSEIYRKIKKLLRKKYPKAGILYSLKEAMRRLGPTGFPFERYVGEILRKKGYKVKVHQFLSGKCATNYEIDILAQKERIIYIGECKYHRLASQRVDLKVALYNFARFLDIKNGKFSKKYKDFKIKSLLITNTKFTTQVKEYAKCVGIDLLGWNYPEGRGLEKIVEELKAFPVTILPSFKLYMKEIFSQKNLMLVEDLLKKDINQLLKETQISKKELLSLIEEAKILLNKNDR